jgi:hypothetical protein
MTAEFNSFISAYEHELNINRVYMLMMSFNAHLWDLQNAR